MSSTDYISQTDAALCAGVQRRTIFNWRKAGRLKTDSAGNILASHFMREHAPYVLVTRLRNTLAALPAHQIPSILLEVLGPDYVRALGNVAGQSTTEDEKK
jgi:hypothetical protein